MRHRTRRPGAIAGAARAVVLAALVLAPGRATAQATPPAPADSAACPSAGAGRCGPGRRPFAWQMRTRYGRETFASGARAVAPWTSYGVAVGRRFATGALEAEVLRVRRFGVSDGAVVLAGSRVLWPRAYGELRLQRSSGSGVLPRSDASAELFQGLAGGWEPSLALRRVQFVDQTAHLVTGSMGKDVGPWYLRGRATLAAQRGAGAHASFSGLARRHLGSRGGFVEAGAGAGTEAVTVAIDPARGTALLAMRRTSSLAVGGRTLVGARLGATLSATYESVEGVPARRGASAGLLVRW